MSKLKDKHVISLGYFLVLVLPALIYILVNFYWYLFDGNALNGDKFGNAAFWLTINGFINFMIVVLEVEH